MRVWNETDLLSALQTAQDSGRSLVEFDSSYDATRFRLSLYNFRRRRQNFVSISIRIEDCKVILTRQDPIPNLIIKRA